MNNGRQVWVRPSNIETGSRAVLAIYPEYLHGVLGM